MAIIVPSGMTVDIDGLGTEINPHIVAAIVTLRSPALGDSATIEVTDPAGILPLPGHDAGMRIVIADTEVFRGHVVRAGGEGTDSGQTLRLIGAAQGGPPPADAPPHVFIWGQNLVSWSLTAELGPQPPDDTTLDPGVLTVTVHPAVRPGMTVTVVGVRSPFDGGYVVDTVTHTFNLGAGFSTSLRVRRP